MSEQQNITKILMDLETKVAYMVTMTSDQTQILDVTDYSGGRPAVDTEAGGQPVKQPFGKKMFAVEMGGTGENEKPNVYTLVWPSEEEYRQKGALPHIAVNTLEGDLIDLGIAKFPESLKTGEQIEAESESAIQKAMETINKLIGLKNVKDKMRNQIATTRFSKLREEILGSSAEKPSLHMVFTGNPGTGKTTIAREYAKVLKAMGLLKKGHIVEVTRKDLVGPHIGKSEERTQEKIEEAKGGILFIDEFYALALDDSPRDFGKQVVDQIVSEMENNRDDLVVIVAGYPDEMKKAIESNPGLKSRFLNYVEFEDFDTRQIGEILDMMAEEKNIVFEAEARKAAIDKIEAQRAKDGKHFGNARTVRNIVDLAFGNISLRVMEGSTKEELLQNYDTDALKKLLTHITVEDVENVRLDSDDAKPEEAPIEFKTRVLTDTELESGSVDVSVAPRQEPSYSDVFDATSTRVTDQPAHISNDEAPVSTPVSKKPSSQARSL